MPTLKTKLNGKSQWVTKYIINCDLKLIQSKGINSTTPREKRVALLILETVFMASFDKQVVIICILLNLK